MFFSPWLCNLVFVALLWVVLIVPVVFMDRVVASLQSGLSSWRWAAQRLRLAYQGYPQAWTRIVLPLQKPPRALLVLLHGLNGHPVQGEHHRLWADPQWAVWCPFVHRLGNDALPFVLRPLQQELLRFIRTYGPKVPILLWGLSNGARLCGALEVWLRTITPNPVMVSAVAGPFLGTKAVSMLGQWAKKLGVFSPGVINELTYNSASAQQLVADMTAPTSLPRQFYFYATRQDDLVFPVASAIPRINQNETAILLNGHDHASIAHAVAAHQQIMGKAFVQQFCTYH